MGFLRGSCFNCGTALTAGQVVSMPTHLHLYGKGGDCKPSPSRELLSCTPGPLSVKLLQFNIPQPNMMKPSLFSTQLSFPLTKYTTATPTLFLCCVTLFPGHNTSKQNSSSSLLYFTALPFSASFINLSLACMFTHIPTHKLIAHFGRVHSCGLPARPLTGRPCKPLCPDAPQTSSLKCQQKYQAVKCSCSIQSNDGTRLACTSSVSGYSQPICVSGPIYCLMSLQPDIDLFCST